MICPKCKGAGIFKKYGECFDCRGSGEMAILKNKYQVIFQGRLYCYGMTLKFTTTSSKEADCEVLSFHRKDVMYEPDNFEGDINLNINLNDIWYRLRNKKTDKTSTYPLWRSIDITKANTIL